jgi:hypothetical protein
MNIAVSIRACSKQSNTAVKQEQRTYYKNKFTAISKSRRTNTLPPDVNLDGPIACVSYSARGGRMTALIALSQSPCTKKVYMLVRLGYFSARFAILTFIPPCSFNTPLTDTSSSSGFFIEFQNRILPPLVAVGEHSFLSWWCCQYKTANAQDEGGNNTPNAKWCRV